MIEGFGIYFDQNLNNTKGMIFFCGLSIRLP